LVRGSSRQRPALRSAPSAWACFSALLTVARLLARREPLEPVVGAGIAAAAFVDKLGAKVVLTGSLGPNAARAAAAAGLQAFAVPPGATVREALKAWRAGELRQL
jgi:hypothetical protein